MKVIRLLALAAAMAALVWSTDALAAGSVVARIDLSEQKMHVLVNGKQAYLWAVSTGRGRYHTPTGTYKPIRMHERYYSRKYHNAPMPYSVFFHGGYAIHGTTEIRHLGHPASHGCVRLHPDNARQLFALIKKVGTKATKIRITQ
jgi:lipoprotein-anchoring transpeptidase ErfK/SrfK